MPRKRGVQNERQGHRQRKVQPDQLTSPQAHLARIAGPSQEIRDAGFTGTSVAHENANNAEPESPDQQ
jgi:hypothetical protein